jgi:glycosyltransferase involved in cell wall biosynthesis
MSISVVINTKDMAETIGAAIKSVHKWADEVIVVDMKSSDETVAIAEKNSAKVFHYKEDLQFADPARNFALSKAKSDWIFVLDADEEVSPELAAVLQKITAGEVEDYLVGDCYYVPRQNIIFGKALAHTGWWPDYQLRFFKNGAVQWTDKVHTQPIFQGQLVYLPTNSQAAIIHHNYQTVSQFIHRLNRYTDLELKKTPEDSAQKYDADHLVRSFSSEFFRRLFVREGFHDGLHGLGLSFLQSFYELTVFLKRWQKLEFKDKTSQAEIITAVESFQKDLQYWTADWHVNHSTGFSKIFWMIRRKMASHTVQ